LSATARREGKKQQQMIKRGGCQDKREEFKAICSQFFSLLSKSALQICETVASKDTIRRFSIPAIFGEKKGSSKGLKPTINL